jgi:hypothetical protein
MLVITWTERWIGRGGPIAWSSRSPDLITLDFFLWDYVRNTVYQLKINDFQHLKAHIKNTVAKVIPNMLQAMWNEAEYCLDICHAIKEAHTKIY